jgi:hypothetical protein
VLGTVVAVCTTAQTLRPGYIGLISDWQTAALLTIAFATIWLILRRRAARQAMRHPAGFAIAALIGLVAVLPPGIVLLVYAGPFIVFGPGLIAAGISIRNRFLTGWALAIGGIGTFEGFFGITNRLPANLWAEWEHPAIYLTLALLTIIAGIVMRIRENTADR